MCCKNSVRSDLPAGRNQKRAFRRLPPILGNDIDDRRMRIAVFRDLYPPVKTEIS